MRRCVPLIPISGQRGKLEPLNLAALCSNFVYYYFISYAFYTSLGWDRYNYKCALFFHISGTTGHIVLKVVWNHIVFFPLARLSCTYHDDVVTRRGLRRHTSFIRTCPSALVLYFVS